MAGCIFLIIVWGLSADILYLALRSPITSKDAQLLVICAFCMTFLGNFLAHFILGWSP